MLRDTYRACDKQCTYADVLHGVTLITGGESEGSYLKQTTMEHCQSALWDANVRQETKVLAQAAHSASHAVDGNIACHWRFDKYRNEMLPNKVEVCLLMIRRGRVRILCYFD